LPPIGERGHGVWVEGSPCSSNAHDQIREKRQKAEKYTPPRSFEIAFLLGRLEFLLVK
jgi:hypothetical protein